MLAFSYKNSLLDEKDIERIVEKLEDERARFREIFNARDYSDERSFINLPFDKEMHEEIESIFEEKKEKNIKKVFLFGAGGSIHGGKGIYHFLNGWKEKGERNSRAELIFVDDILCNETGKKLRILSEALKRGENVILNCITKSGKTMETLANFQIFLDFLKKKRRDYRDYVVITTNFSSELYKIAERKNFSVLAIPEKIAGRYSVFSAVGIFPLSMAGMEKEKIFEGAKKAVSEVLKKSKNVSSLSAGIVYLNYIRGADINVIFSFVENFEELAKWYIQLYAESLGKEGKGITPIFSRATQDLHYFAQLYLDGRRNKITSFIKISEESSKNACKELVVPEIKGFSELVGNIQGENLGNILSAIYGGVKKAYEKKAIPFTEYILNRRSEQAIAEFMQYKMIEVAFLGYLLGVNPFNQPAVEAYKSETRRILKEKKNEKK